MWSLAATDSMEISAENSNDTELVIVIPSTSLALNLQ